MSVRQTETAICTNIQQSHKERFTAEHAEKPIKTPTVSQQTRQQQHHIRFVKKRAMTGKCVFRCLSGSLGKHRTPQTKPTKWVGNISWFCTCADIIQVIIQPVTRSRIPGSLIKIGSIYQYHSVVQSQTFDYGNMYHSLKSHENCIYNTCGAIRAGHHFAHSHLSGCFDSCWDTEAGQSTGLQGAPNRWFSLYTSNRQLWELSVVSKYYGLFLTKAN